MTEKLPTFNNVEAKTLLTNYGMLDVQLQIPEVDRRFVFVLTAWS